MLLVLIVFRLCMHLSKVFKVIIKYVTHYLEVKVEAFTQVDFLGKTFVFAHVKRQGVVSVSIFAFRKEDGVIETDKLASRHPLIIFFQCRRMKNKNKTSRALIVN